jgi:hypothetical protein
VRLTYFNTPAAIRSWLSRHHRRAKELLVGFYKRGSGKPSITWPEAVDEALCFGWIDGVRHRVDDLRYTIRFTPRKPGSNWSAVDLKRIRALKRQGRMRPAERQAGGHPGAPPRDPDCRLGQASVNLPAAPHHAVNLSRGTGIPPSTWC